MRIVLDASGGDKAPRETVRGAVLAARSLDCTVILLGPRAAVAAELAHHNTQGLDLPIVDAPETIGMDEHPTLAVRRKPNSPHAIGLRMVRDHEADAFVSAGHSGATMAGATLILGRAGGVERPALAGLFPALDRTLLVLDVGATTDCKPVYLEQFAHLGSHYAQRALGLASPRVALLSNGEEAVKGDRLVQEGHALLRQSQLRFVGNAEPKDALVNDVCDVLVCDGFVGNLFLKTSEAIAKLIQDQAKGMITRGLAGRILAGLAPTALIAAFSRRGGRTSALLGSIVGGPALTTAALVPPLLQLRRRADYRNYGGAPLLGLRGVAIIAHGRSDAKAVMHAIRQASEAVERGALTDAPLSTQPAE